MQPRALRGETDAMNCGRGGGRHNPPAKGRAYALYKYNQTLNNEINCCASIGFVM